MGSTNLDDSHRLVARLRGGYRPTDEEVAFWNVAETIDTLRSQVTEADLAWITPPISEDDGPRAEFYLALLKPLATNTGIRALLTQRFETASPYLKMQLLWRLLDDPDLPRATHRTLFDFVTSEWDTFQGCVSYLGTPSEVIQAALRRLAECPETKRWIYLCCMPQYATDQRAVKGLLKVASGSADAFTADVSRVLLERFFSDGR